MVTNPTMMFFLKNNERATRDIHTMTNTFITITSFSALVDSYDHHKMNTIVAIERIARQSNFFIAYSVLFSKPSFLTYYPLDYHGIIGVVTIRTLKKS